MPRGVGAVEARPFMGGRADAARVGSAVVRPVRGKDIRCAFCHDAFVPLDAPLFCSTCRALLHDGCWHEAGRCPSLGCRGPADLGPRAEPRDLALLSAALRALALAPWAWTALSIGALGGRFVFAAAAVLAAALSLAYACPRRATWLLILSSVGLSAALFVFVQAQRVFLTVD